MRKRCPACLGYGRINGMGYIQQDCPACNVTGFVEVEEVKEPQVYEIDKEGSIYGWMESSSAGEESPVIQGGIKVNVLETDTPEEVAKKTREVIANSSVGDEGKKTRKKRKDAGMPKQRRTPVKSRIKVDERNQPVGVAGQEV